MKGVDYIMCYMKDMSNKKDDDGRTAFMVAAKYGHIEVFLLDKEA